MNHNFKKKINLKKNFRRNPKLKLIDRLVKISRVSKVTKGGKNLRFRAIVVIGDRNGQVGVGVAKANIVGNAFKKAKADGQKNLIKFPLTKTLSIPHSIIGHFGACKIIIRPSTEGSGVIAGGATRIVLEAAGVQNIVAKQLGSNNLLNNARATIWALKNLTTKYETDKKRS